MYSSFTDEMKRVFDHPVQGRDASYRLTAICQGSQSVADYTIEFRTLAAESGCNDMALQGAFYRGPREQLKDELATRDDAALLDQLIQTSICLDNHLRECRRERSSQPNDSGSPLPSTNDSLPPPPLSDSVPGPMQLGRACLTPKEHAHRRAANLCLYCGRLGHFIASCPSRPPGSPLTRVLMVSQT